MVYLNDWRGWVGGWVDGWVGGGGWVDGWGLTDLAPENNALISRMSVSAGTQIEVASS